MRLADLSCRLSVFILLASCTAYKSNSNHSFSGQYCTPPNLSGFCYTLHKDHRFEYAYASCTYGMRGQGHYKIVQDSIVFHFEPFADSASTPKINIQKINSRTDSLLVDLEVFEEDKTPLIGYTAKFLDDKAEFVGGRVGDVDGQLKWRASSDRPRRMRVMYTGYEPVWVNLDSNGYYKIGIQMKNTFGTEMPPQTLTYRLASLNADSMVLGSFEDQSVISLYRWKKHHPKKAHAK